MKDLTERQLEVLAVYWEFARDHARPPSISEVMAAASVTTYQGAWDLINRLVKKGYLREAGRSGLTRHVVLAGVSVKIDAGREGDRLRETLGLPAGSPAPLPGYGYADGSVVPRGWLPVMTIRGSGGASPPTLREVADAG